MDKVKAFKSMKCCICKTNVENVGEYATSVKCYDCINKELTNLSNTIETNLKGGNDEMETKNVKPAKVATKAPVVKKDPSAKKRSEVFKELEPKILAMTKEGKSPAEISKILGGHPAVPKIKRMIASSKK